MSTLNDFLKSVKEQIPMLRMLSHMGIQDNQIQTDLRVQFLKNHTDDLQNLENVRYIAKSLSISLSLLGHLLSVRLAAARRTAWRSSRCGYPVAIRGAIAEAIRGELSGTYPVEESEVGARGRAGARERLRRGWCFFLRFFSCGGDLVVLCRSYPGCGGLR